MELSLLTDWLAAQTKPKNGAVKKQISIVLIFYL